MPTTAFALVGAAISFTVDSTDSIANIVSGVHGSLCAGSTTLATLGATLSGGLNTPKTFSWTPTSAQSGNSYTLCFRENSEDASVSVSVFSAGVDQPLVNTATRFSFTRNAPSGIRVTRVEKWQRCTSSGMGCTDFDPSVTTTTYTPVAADATGNNGSGYFLRAVNVGYSYTPSGATTAVTGTIDNVDSDMAVIANRDPTIATAVADFSLATGSSQSHPLAFADADGDSLTYMLSDSSSDGGEVTATYADGTVRVTGDSRGSVTVRITADDGQGGTVTEEFVVTVTNADPMGGDAPAALSLNLGATEGNTRQVNFSDLDMDNLSCEATSSQSNFPSRLTAEANAQGCLVTVTTDVAGDATISVTASDGQTGSTAARQRFRVTITAPPPAESSSSSSGGVVALALIGAGAYYWWKKRQLKNGADPAKMALLPEVSFDLDRNDNRAFFTKFNWQNPGDSNWQLRGNATVHTKYSGELLDWNADSRIGYRLKGKLGEFNPYLHGKFVQNAPGNAEMQKTYSLGLNYAIPNRFSVQFLQPDDEIWRYSLKMRVNLPAGMSLQLEQPNSDLKNYGFGVSWRKSKIRYGISGETGSNSYRFTGQFSF